MYISHYKGVKFTLFPPFPFQFKFLYLLVLFLQLKFNTIYLALKIWISLIFCTLLVLWKKEWTIGVVSSLQTAAIFHLNSYKIEVHDELKFSGGTFSVWMYEIELIQCGRKYIQIVWMERKLFWPLYRWVVQMMWIHLLSCSKKVKSWQAGQQQRMMLDGWKHRESISPLFLWVYRVPVPWGK